MRSLKVIVLLVLCIMLSSCMEKEPIKIGIVGTMSGPGSDLSVSGRRGAELAVQNINDNGGINGRDLQLVAKDDQNNAEIAKSLVDTFISEGISVVIGHYTSGMMLESIEKVNKSDIIYIGPTVSADGLSKQDDHFIRFIASTKEQAIVLASVAQKEAHKRFVIVVDNKNKGFNDALLANFEEQLTANEGQVVSVTFFDELTMECLNGISKKMEDEVDAVFVISNATDFINVAQHLYKDHAEIPMYGPLWAHTDELIVYGGEVVDNSFMVGAIDSGNSSEAFKEANQAYETKYGKSMSFSAMYSYEVVYAIREALLMEESTDPQVIKKNIIDIGHFSGLQSEFVIDQYGDNSRVYIVEKIVNGDYKRVD